MIPIRTVVASDARYTTDETYTRYMPSMDGKTHRKTEIAVPEFWRAKELVYQPGTHGGIHYVDAVLLNGDRMRIFNIEKIIF